MRLNSALVAYYKYSIPTNKKAYTMFNRFYKTKAQPQPLAPSKVICNHTGNTLYTGSFAMCAAYVRAYGLCHVAG